MTSQIFSDYQKNSPFFESFIEKDPLRKIVLLIRAWRKVDMRIAESLRLELLTGYENCDQADYKTNCGDCIGQYEGCGM